ncbi:hypothetical protein MBAV_005578 [Candidatus Magnetobacterium bavaricum]|uniref:Uncharacterized protein n=1 Tax=Candidatus Magnetobacterium bavaricum TaxID=29290 RepID=A0A0F3GNF6_9BACT|nr:hypothetical protein MBAV_005578 [Candidatus Magnetobacterium bavaricum]
MFSVFILSYNSFLYILTPVGASMPSLTLLPFISTIVIVTRSPSFMASSDFLVNTSILPSF